jgi:nudix-type nucleoside diphosphatase (YffH/AdpP family)
VLSHDWYLLKKITFDYQRNNGDWQRQTREVYDQGNGAAILLYNREQRTVVLTRQFRLPVFVNGHDGLLIEVAAGLLEGAAPQEAHSCRSRRRNRLPRAPRAAGVRGFMSPGSVTEKLHFFIAEYDAASKVSEGGGLEEETEELEVLEWAFDEALGGVLSWRNLRCEDHHAAAVCGDEKPLRGLSLNPSLASLRSGPKIAATLAQEHRRLRCFTRTGQRSFRLRAIEHLPASAASPSPQAPGKSRQLPRRTNHPMARRDNRNRVLAIRRAHRPDRTRVADLLGDLAVATGLAERNGQQRCPDLFLKLRADKLQIQLEMMAPPAKYSRSCCAVRSRSGLSGASLIGPSRTRPGLSFSQRMAASREPFATSFNSPTGDARVLQV